MQKMRQAPKKERSLKSYTFRVVIEEDPFEDGIMAYHAYCPALRHHGASTWGYTQAEALKEKRAVLQSLIDRVRKNFNVSIAEIDHLDEKDSAVMGIALVSNDGRLNDRLLSKLIERISSQPGVTIEDYQIELF